MGGIGRCRNRAEAEYGRMSFRTLRSATAQERCGCRHGFERRCGGKGSDVEGKVGTRWRMEYEALERITMPARFTISVASNKDWKCIRTKDAASLRESIARGSSVVRVVVWVARRIAGNVRGTVIVRGRV
ncbi:hypothetical protein TRAPUB_5414 [Trametes pubescens]|uniref:Uncharacterized protein n=1 Tax=Trametes pubescens TaxID=154538 RepID=A0A1M2V8T3_TRAPU|nr:hypothetical protein TRAPUB_5414 [Trametes pubescens]